MTTIAAMNSVIPQPSAIVQATAATLSPVAPASPRPPAVVISLSSGTLSAVSHPGDKTAEQRINSLVDEVKTHNDIASAVAQFDWAKFAKIAGAEKAEAEKGASLRYLDYSAARIGRSFGESGIDVRPATDKQVAETGVASGTLLVRDFSFKVNGSAYAITAQEDGTLVGTRDGQAWKTWKTTPGHPASSGGSSDAALATLQAILAGIGPSKSPASTGLISLTA